MDKTDWQVLIFLFVFILGVIILGVWIADSSCAKQANLMGVNYSYAPMQGCMIEHAPGKWVPLKNYRVL